MILDDDDFNPLCSLQTPKYYIQPSDIYKRVILFMIIITEIIIYIFILPYLKGYTETFINFKTTEININSLYYIIQIFFSNLCYQLH